MKLPTAMQSNTKIAAVAAVIVVAMVAVFFFGATGNIISKGSQPASKEDISGAIAVMDAACTSNINSLKDQVQSCSSDRDALNTSLTNEKIKNAALTSDFDSLASSSAKEVCCRPGITNTSWSIEGNAIICAGNLTVECP